MNELASLLAAPDALSARLKVGVLEPTKLRKQAELIAGMAQTALNVEETGALQLRIRDAAAAGRLDQLRGRDIREACKVFTHAPHPLVADVEVMDAVVAEVERTQRRSALLALVGAYVDGFEQSESFALFAARVRGLIGRWTGRPVDPWPELHKTVDLFQPAKAPPNIAAAVLGSDKPHERVLAFFGLDTDVRRAGDLTAAAFVAAAEAVAAKPPGEAVALQRRLVDWATTRDRRLAYPKAFTPLVRALLRPWANSDPLDHHRKLLIETLTEFGGGDPRTKPAAWGAVRDHAPEEYAVLMRWLTQASVFQFFDIVDRSLAHDPADRKMWAYRRKFWTAYLLGEEGAPTIEEAWVAFGADGAQLARQAARENNGLGLGSFGIQEDKSSYHAALLMRIGDLVIVDWSHDAKCNFWRRGDRNAPALYRTRYPLGTLYSAPDKHSHAAPGTYNWQKKFAGIIESRAFYSERRSWRPKLA